MQRRASRASDVGDALVAGGRLRVLGGSIRLAVAQGRLPRLARRAAAFASRRTARATNRREVAEPPCRQAAKGRRCVAPFGMEEGSEIELPGAEFGLVVGEPAEFRLLGSSVRRDDVAGTVVERWQVDEIEELAPVEATLTKAGEEGRLVPVRLTARATEIGTLELFCVARDGKGRWQLEFNVRQGA